MVSRKLTKPAAVAAAVAIAAGGGTYTSSAVLLPTATAAAQIPQPGNPRVSSDTKASVRASAATVGLARDFGISRTAARALIESTYR